MSDDPTTSWIDFDGPCPFVLCLSKVPHTHTICPDCGAVRHGNILCRTCRAYSASGLPR